VVKLQFKSRKQRRAEGRRAGKKVRESVKAVYFAELARSNDFDKAATEADMHVRDIIKKFPEFKKDIVTGALKALQNIRKKVRESEQRLKDKRLSELDADMQNGRRCLACGIAFEEAHGYATLCPSCWESAEEETRKNYPAATIGIKGG